MAKRLSHYDRAGRVRMAQAGIRLLTDRALHERISLAAREAAVRRFSASRVVPMYEAAYERLAMQGAQAPV